MTDFDPPPDSTPNAAWLWIPTGALGAVLFLSIGVLIGEAGAPEDQCEDDSGQATEGRPSIRSEPASNAGADGLARRGMRSQEPESRELPASWEELGLQPVPAPARDILPDAGLDPQPRPAPRPGGTSTDGGDSPPPVLEGAASPTIIAPVSSCSGIECRSSLQLTAVCGMRTMCDEGEVCCNPSCGICTEPGESCSQELCE